MHTWITGTAYLFSSLAYKIIVSLVCRKIKVNNFPVHLPEGDQGTKFVNYMNKRVLVEGEMVVVMHCFLRCIILLFASFSEEHVSVTSPRYCSDKDLTQLGEKP